MTGKLYTAVIIGSSNIAKIHYNFISENNVKKFFFVGRKKKKIDEFIKKNKIPNASFLNRKFLNNKNTIISVCNNTNYHQDYLDYINSKNKLLIVEKPLVSIKIFKEQYLRKVKFYYKKFKKLIVVYPMTYLARSFNDYIRNKRINSIKIYYYTKGNNTYDDIYIDLLPHCLTFFKELCKLRKKYLGPLIKINKKKIYKYKNDIRLTFKNIKLTILLKENYKGKKSKFFFKVNKSIYCRETHMVNKCFKNYIKLKNYRLIEIENPMRQFFFNTFKNINNRKYFNENKKNSLWLSNLAYEISNF